MKRFQFTIYLLSIFILMGCSYPQIELNNLDELTFNNKRLENKTRSIEDFIRPQETEEILDNFIMENYSNNTETNLVLNLLNFTQDLKLVHDKKEFWQYPKETISKGGDCEDKVFLLLSMLMQSNVNDVYGVKGKCFGQGHMWVEYKGFILDTIKTKPELMPINKSTGYVPYFKFGKANKYYCQTERSRK